MVEPFTTLLCCQLNTDWLGNVIYRQESFESDGRSFTVKSSRPSVDLRIAQIEQEQKQAKPMDIQADQEYRLETYPLAAGASFGKVPTPYEAKHELGLKDFALWHGTVTKLLRGEPDPVDEKEKKSENKNPVG